MFRLWHGIRIPAGKYGKVDLYHELSSDNRTTTGNRGLASLVFLAPELGRRNCHIGGWYWGSGLQSDHWPTHTSAGGRMDL